ncbi:hypothetical protein HU200_021465 [Digitaria exilis]|uniref:Uncharacterized protein n=1 Tax=Digitaria exilis TaxID=1010633 RepID=A0A835KES6_9POAL|nr:hypothetical protein HU200_021465 [Digitaria exilis]
MNMGKKTRVLMLTLFLLAFLVQCRPQQQIDAGTSKRPGWAHILTPIHLEFCETVTDESVCGAPRKLCYCCWSQKPKALCNDHWYTCSEQCPRS